MSATVPHCSAHMTENAIIPEPSHSIAPEMSSYSKFLATQKEFEALKSTYAQMTCDAFGLYIVRSYEDRHASTCNHFVYSASAETEEELIALVETMPIHNTYLILPIIKRGDGEILTKIKQWNVLGSDEHAIITKSFYEYRGECKVLLETCDEFYPNPNERTWIPLEEVVAFGEYDPVEGYAISKEPYTWKPYKVHKSQMMIVWKEI